jgi:hypothetical protein
MKYRCPSCRNRTLSIAKVCSLDSGSIECSGCGANAEGFKIWNRIRWILILLLASWLGLYGLAFMLLSLSQPFSWSFTMGALPIVGIVILAFAVPLRLKKAAS